MIDALCEEIVVDTGRGPVDAPINAEVEERHGDLAAYCFGSAVLPSRALTVVVAASGFEPARVVPVAFGGFGSGWHDGVGVGVGVLVFESGWGGSWEWCWACWSSVLRIGQQKHAYI